MVSITAPPSRLLSAPRHVLGETPSSNAMLRTPLRQERQTSSEGSNRKVSSGLNRFAAPFVPSNTSPSAQSGPLVRDVLPCGIMQYHNAYSSQLQGDDISSTQPLPYDPYTTAPSMTASDHTSQTINPYQDASNVGGTAYYSGAASYTQPVSNLHPSRMLSY